MNRHTRLLLGLLAAALAACSPLPPGKADTVPQGSGAAEGRIIYLTGAFNGAGLTAIDPLTLEDASARPLLPISYTGASNSAVAAALDGGALAVMNYWYGAGTPVREGLDISVFDARTGMLRARFHPEVPVIVDGLSPDGSRIYARSWPPRELTAERLVLDAGTGTVLEREPRFSWAGDVVAFVKDERRRRLYTLLAPSDPKASGPRPVELVAWDLQRGTELWRLSVQALVAGRWPTGREVAGRPLHSSLVPGLALGPDGRQLALVRAFGGVPNGTLWLVDAEAGKVISQRDYARESSFLERLLTPAVAEAKSWEESVAVSASFSLDGTLLHVYAHSTTVDSEAEPKHQYLGMTTVRPSDAKVLGSDVKNEKGWYENRINWIRSSPDGRWLYVFLERTGSFADPRGYVLRRLDPASLQVLAERRFDGYRQSFSLAVR